MKFIASIAAVALALVVPTTRVLASDEVVSLDSLRTMNQTQLNSLYVDAEPGQLPDGDSQGTAVFFPGTRFNIATQMLAALAWQGKIFDTDSGILVNKVFGFKLIKAEVFYGDSLFDGKESIIIDYSNTSILASRIRDEIREVSPGLYLGRAYFRGPLWDVMVVNFVLDFTQQ